MPAHGVTACFVGEQLELLEPLGAESPIAAFLERHPAGGLHHVAQVHLAPRYGKDKLSFDASSRRRHRGRTMSRSSSCTQGDARDAWWRAGDKPWQTLATAYVKRHLMRLPAGVWAACWAMLRS